MNTLLGLGQILLQSSPIDDAVSKRPECVADGTLKKMGQGELCLKDRVRFFFWKSIHETRSEAKPAHCQKWFIIFDYEMPNNWCFPFFFHDRHALKKKYRNEFPVQIKVVYTMCRLNCPVSTRFGCYLTASFSEALETTQFFCLTQLSLTIHWYVAFLAQKQKNMP